MLKHHDALKKIQFPNENIGSKFLNQIIDFGSQCSDEYRQALKRSFPDSLPFHSQKNLNDPLKKLGQNYQI